MAINTLVVTGVSQLTKKYLGNYHSDSPVYYKCTACNKFTISYTNPVLCKGCGSVDEMVFVKTKDLLSILNG